MENTNDNIYDLKYTIIVINYCTMHDNLWRKGTLLSFVLFLTDHNPTIFIFSVMKKKKKLRFLDETG